MAFDISGTDKFIGQTVSGKLEIFPLNTSICFLPFILTFINHKINIQWDFGCGESLHWIYLGTITMPFFEMAMVLNGIKFEFQAVEWTNLSPEIGFSHGFMVNLVCNDLSQNTPRERRRRRLYCNSVQQEVELACNANRVTVSATGNIQKTCVQSQFTSALQLFSPRPWHISSTSKQNGRNAKCFIAASTGRQS